MITGKVMADLMAPLSMILVQIFTTVMLRLSKVVLNKGIYVFVLLAYRNVFGAGMCGRSLVGRPSCGFLSTHYSGTLRLNMEYNRRFFIYGALTRKSCLLLIREQKIKVLTPKEAGYAIQLSNKSLLDVRPSTEHNKAKVKGSAWVPIFDTEDPADIGAVSRKISNFVMGGWWSGSSTLSYDKNFISKVEAMFPKDADLIVICQKGLRSLAACEQLYKAGYKNLFWVQGGLEAAEEEDYQREGPRPFKLAGIGGVSEFFGWTDQQRAYAAKEGWGYSLVFTGRLIGAILLADALFFGAQHLRLLFREL